VEPARWKSGGNKKHQKGQGKKGGAFNLENICL
jgi:hypothetical protein